MKKVIFYVVVSAISITGFSQEKVLNLEFYNKIYCSDNGNLALLPFEKAFLKGKSTAFSSTVASLKLDGGESKFKTPYEDTLHFYIMTNNDYLNNFEHIKLYKVSKKNNNKREVVYMTQPSLGNRSRKEDNDLLTFNVKKISAEKFELVLTDKLETGEYFFMNRIENAGSSYFSCYTFSVN